MGPVIILLVIVALLVFWAISLYNSLVSLRAECNNAFAQIDVQLKRRYDLIPNLVETVKGYMKYEQETLDKVISARNRALSAGTVDEKIAADGAVTQALSHMFALSEAYPDLKANQNMLNLQEELTSTENRVGYARQAYNDVVTRYNTKIQQFPASLFAGGFQPAQLFQVENAAERDVVKVSF